MHMKPQQQTSGENTLVIDTVCMTDREKWLEGRILKDILLKALLICKRSQPSCTVEDVFILIYQIV